jgi:signal transduction histidine kinase
MFKVDKEFLQTIKVLYVEDDMDIAEEIYDLLDGFFLKVDMAHNGADGLKLFQEHKHDIVLSDIQMPVMCGIEMSKKIKEVSADTPIIISSAFSDSSHLKDALSIGVSDYLIKPLNIDNFIHSFDKVFLSLYNKHLLQIKNQELMQAKEELQKLNENLEQQVKIEVQKNKEKDHMLYTQSKNAQMGEMMSMIAHQWRQPLNALSASAMNIALMQTMNRLEDKVIEDHSVFVEQQVQKMSNIIDDFMNFFKSDEKAHKFMLEDLLKDIKSLIGAQFNNRNIKLDCLSGCDETIVSHKKELEHVLINLVSNARDAFENKSIEEPYISINHSIYDDKSIISVEDNAGGIPNDIIDKIFNPYFTTKEQGKGTGLGLHMSKRIVKEVLKGNLEVENTISGAKFKIILPQELQEDRCV